MRFAAGKYPAWTPTLWRFAEASPLAVFLLYATLAPPDARADWHGPYDAASVAAALINVLLLASGRTLHRIHAALALYFMSGSAALAADWSWLNDLYGQWQAVAMFAWVLLAGAVFTAASASGFVGAPANIARSLVRRTSLQLLAVTLLSTAVSVHFAGNILLSAYAPFVVLFFVYEWMQKRCIALSEDTRGNASQG